MATPTHENSTSSTGRAQMPPWLRGLGIILAVLAFFVLLLQVLAHGMWLLPGVKSPETRDDLVRLITGDEGIPRSLYAEDGRRLDNRPIGEWPLDRPRTFRQSPMLDQVAPGGRWTADAPYPAYLIAKPLPPVAERLPEQPMMMKPFELEGGDWYGGDWLAFGKSVQDVGGILVHRGSYEYLCRWSSQGDEVLPNIAHKPKVLNGGRVFEITLHKGIRWSDGVELTTDDVMFWYEHVLLNKEITKAPKLAYQQDGEPMKVERVDRYTFRCVFPKPNGLFERYLASETGYDPIAFPKHYLQQFHPAFVDKDTLDRRTKEAKQTFWYQLFDAKANEKFNNPDCPRLSPWILSGPVKAGDTVVVLVRNPYYWKVDSQGNQLPYMDRVRFEIIENPEVQKMRIYAGKFSFFTTRFRTDEYSMYANKRGEGNYRIAHYPNCLGTINTLSVNQTRTGDPVLRDILRDKRFRFALSHAINRQEINTVCFGGAGVPRNEAPVGEKSPFRDPLYETAYTEYDPAKSAALLDEMGLTMGPKGIRLRPDGKPLVITLETQELSIGTQPFELIAEYWTNIGVKTDYKLWKMELFYERKKALMHDVAGFMGTEAMHPLLDPRFFLPRDQESNQFIGYDAYLREKDPAKRRPENKPPPEVQRCYDLYQQIIKTTDEAEQVKLWAEISKINRENLWVIGTVGNLFDYAVVSNHVRNVPPKAVTGWMFRATGNIAPECLVYDENGKAGW